jgi:hypothetical protein
MHGVRATAEPEYQCCVSVGLEKGNVLPCRGLWQETLGLPAELVVLDRLGGGVYYQWRVVSGAVFGGQAFRQEFQRRPFKHQRTLHTQLTSRTTC